ncbi:MAG: hypothetical protein QM627_04785 [Luteolibacter sp.]
MNPLNLNPLPTARDEENRASRPPQEHGFIDDAVIHSLLAGPAATRSRSNQQDLALSADDNDFAGWQFPAPASTVLPASAPVRASALAADTHFDPEPEVGPRKPLFAPRSLEYTEPETDAVHANKHHWWIAAAAVIMSALLLSYLLLTLAHRPMPVDETSVPSSPEIIGNFH